MDRNVNKGDCLNNFKNTTLNKKKIIIKKKILENDVSVVDILLFSNFYCCDYVIILDSALVAQLGATPLFDQTNMVRYLARPNVFFFFCFF